jgi:pimeloyl-ACP methyl ester carboxylesterase
MIFHPERMHPGNTYDIPYPHSDVKIAMDSEDTLHLVDFHPDSSVPFKGIVVYFHGNRKHIGFYADQTPSITRWGYRVLMIDYPGYGKSSGKLTEKKLYEWSEIVYRIAHKQVAADSIFIYGKSLGTGVATRLASIRGNRGLILETPYYDMPAVAARFLPIYPTAWMMHYQFPLHEYLAAVKSPVLLFHGTEDEVISFKQALRLKPILKPSDRMLIVTGGNHNGLTNYPMVRRALDSIWSQ